MPYLDHAATTPLRQEAYAAMLPWLTTEFGNPSSAHGPGRRARVAVEQARETIAMVLGCSPAEVVFTSGGSESDNAAIAGVVDVALRSGVPRSGLVTTQAEHHAVLDPAQRFKAAGGSVFLVAPTAAGAVGSGAIAAAISEATALVSVIWVNNETGAESPLPDISSAARAMGALIHTDAVQAAGHISLNVESANVDLLSISAHKISGPKGIGLLYIRAGTPWTPLIVGGAQERGRRAGTENVAAIVGFAEALRLAETEREETCARQAMLRDRLLARLLEGLGDRVHVHTPGVVGSTTTQPSSPHILSVSISGADGKGLDGEMLLLGLDLEGVHVSAGSACTSGALAPSHVLRSMGVPDPVAQATVRFSLGRGTTIADIDAAAEATIKVGNRLDRSQGSVGLHT